MAKRVVLAYSGGLDTSVAVRWMGEELGVEVIALVADVGQGGDFEAIRKRALAAGAAAVAGVACRGGSARGVGAPAPRANARYEGKYPLVSSLSRPLIVSHMVAAAREHGADAVAHGCTGKGNDQVRFEVSTRALAPDLETLAPVRGWGLTREQSIEYAERFGIPVTGTKDSPYSSDQNLWGGTIECGVLEDPWVQPPEEVFELTSPTAAEPIEMVLAFEEGLPVAIDGRRLPLHELIGEMTRVVGSYGWGRVDMVENRRVGIKSREIYECPGALALLMAHSDLEDLTLERDLAHEKARPEPRWAALVSCARGDWGSRRGRPASRAGPTRPDEPVEGAVRGAARRSGGGIHREPVLRRPPGGRRPRRLPGARPRARAGRHPHARRAGGP